MKEEITSREKRRRRRIRNQILAYLLLAVLIVLAAVGILYGAGAVKKYLIDYNDKVNEAIEAAESGVSTQEETESSDELSTESDTSYTVYAGDDEALREMVDSMIKELTLEEKVAGLFVVTPESITGVGTAVKAGDGTKKALEENPVGGLVYSASNYKDDEQFRTMLANTRIYSKYALFLAVSKECGDNKDFGMEKTPGASEITDEAGAHEAYASISARLADFGINLNLAPVAGVVSQEDTSGLKGRTFGSDALAAAPLVSAAVRAMQENEVSAVLQKFPSEGSAAKSLEELRNSELVIYSMAVNNGADAIMVSNEKASAIAGDDVPASLSHDIVTGILRNELGFDGVIFSDSLDDKRITSDYSESQAAVAAIQAGVDVLFRPADYRKAYEGVLAAVADSTISEERIDESVRRIYMLKYKHALDAG